MFSDKTQLIIGVQGIHQIAELSITIRSKVTQEEHFTGNRIVHRVTEFANLVDEFGDHLWLVGDHTTDAL